MKFLSPLVCLLGCVLMVACGDGGDDGGGGGAKTTGGGSEQHNPLFGRGDTTSNPIYGPNPLYRGDSMGDDAQLRPSVQESPLYRATDDGAYAVEVVGSETDIQAWLTDADVVMSWRQDGAIATAVVITKRVTDQP